MENIKEKIEAVKKSADMVLLITNTIEAYPRPRIMQQLEDEKDGCIWFATSKKSRKIQEIEIDPVVTVYYINSKNNDAAFVAGEASILNDDETKKHFWRDTWTKYWPEGVEDENYTLIRIEPSHGECVPAESFDMGEIDY